jgi:hypothetical protein
MFNMDEIKNIVDEVGIASLENNIKLAAVAVVSDSGNLVYQTENWDLTQQTNIIMNVIKGGHSFVLSDVEYSVVGSNSEGIIGTNNSGMGHLLFAPFQGGILVSYALPQADPPRALTFLKNYAVKLNGKV